MPAPIRFGRYAVRRRIGSGGFATVWLAYDEQLDAPVAVKVLAENWTEDHQMCARFVEEGRYLRRVESRHVVTVYDAGELDDGRPYLVMTYADQGTLNDRLQVAVLTVGQALEVVRQVGSGLQALHDRGILHRDIKPANVLFRSIEGGVEGERGEIRAMVGDLGLGKAVDASSRLTMIAGTPSYVAPEQAQGESPTSAADQYSLGVLTYLLLAGRTPWTHASLAAAADPPPAPPLSTEEHPFSTAVEDVVGRALARNREDRWPSVRAYVEALGETLEDAADEPGHISTQWLPPDPDLTRPGRRPSPAPARGELAEPDLPGRRRRRLPVVAAALAALVAGAIGGWFAVRGLDRSVTLTDSRDALSVTVPGSWDVVADEPWTPPDAKGQYSALSAGDRRGWQDDGEGVFVGVLPVDKLPSDLPGHATCGNDEDPITDTRGGDRTRTVYYTDCPGVTVERVVQVADNRVLWVQVHGESRATVTDVLGSVEVRGFG